MSDQFLHVLEALKATLQGIDPAPYPPPALFYISPDDDNLPDENGKISGFSIPVITAPNDRPMVIISAFLSRGDFGIKRKTQVDYTRRWSVEVLIVMDTHEDDREALPDRMVEEIARAYFKELERVLLGDPSLGGTVLYWGNPNSDEDDLSPYIGKIHWYESGADTPRIWWGLAFDLPVITEHEFMESYA
jgi:hypothetical protein